MLLFSRNGNISTTDLACSFIASLNYIKCIHMDNLFLELIQFVLCNQRLILYRPSCIHLQQHQHNQPITILLRFLWILFLQSKILQLLLQLRSSNLNHIILNSWLDSIVLTNQLLINCCCDSVLYCLCLHKL